MFSAALYAHVRTSLCTLHMRSRVQRASGIPCSLAVVASSFNSALSVRQYLNAPDGAVYGFAPTPPPTIWSSPFRSPRTAVPGLYLASAYVCRARQSQHQRPPHPTPRP
jgi:phytoene dehydrogenase-like protein